MLLFHPFGTLQLPRVHPFAGGQLALTHVFLLILEQFMESLDDEVLLIVGPTLSDHLVIAIAMMGIVARRRLLEEVDLTGQLRNFLFANCASLFHLSLLFFWGAGGTANFQLRFRISKLGSLLACGLEAQSQAVDGLLELETRRNAALGFELLQGMSLRFS